MKRIDKFSIGMLVGCVICLIICFGFFAFYMKYHLASLYEIAADLYAKADYENAIKLFRWLSDYKDSNELLQNAIILMHGGTV